MQIKLSYQYSDYEGHNPWHTQVVCVINILSDLEVKHTKISQKVSEHFYEQHTYLFNEPFDLNPSFKLYKWKVLSFIFVSRELYLNTTLKWTKCEKYDK